MIFQETVWPKQEIAETLSHSCVGSNGCTKDFFLKILNQSTKDEIEHEVSISSFRQASEYRRSSVESNEIARNFKIAKRLKQRLRNSLARNEYSDGIIDSVCKELMRKGLFHNCLGREREGLQNGRGKSNLQGN